MTPGDQNDSADVMRGAVRVVRAAGPMEAHFALTEVREGAYETPVLLACKAGGSLGRCRLGDRVGAARGATAYEALARAQMFAASAELLGACKSALRALEDNLSPGPMDEDAKTALRLVLAKIPGGEA